MLLRVMVTNNENIPLKYFSIAHGIFEQTCLWCLLITYKSFIS